MADEVRIVIYVYSTTTLFIASPGTIGMLKMDDHYGNAVYDKFRNNADNELAEGVYGLVSDRPVTLKVPSISTDSVFVRSDVMRKDPWPPPPPPPPESFSNRADWPDHLQMFMVPTGGIQVRWVDGRRTEL